MSKPARRGRKPDVIAFRRPPEPGDDMTIAHVLQRYLDYAAHKLAPKTYDNRKFYLEAFIADHGDTKVSEARRTQLELWILKHDKDWPSDSTKRTIVAMLQTAMNWAANVEEIIARNPYRGFCWREGEARKPISENVFSAMLRNTDALFRRLLVFADESGARPGEISALDWPHIHFDIRKAILEKHKTSRTQKKPKPRVIHLSDVSMKLLLWMHARRKDDGPVFRNSDGKRWNKLSLASRIRRIRERAGLPDDVVLYSLRHKFGTDCAEAGHNSSTTAELLGHDNPRTTDKYYINLSSRDRHLRESLEAIKIVRRKNK